MPKMKNLQKHIAIEGFKEFKIKKIKL